MNNIMTVMSESQGSLENLHFVQVMLVLDKVVQNLKETMDVLSRNTGRDYLLIVNSDNGGAPCADYEIASNMPWRGSKFNYFEGGIKVPAFIYSPSSSVIPAASAGSSYTGFIHHVDWIATLRSVAGATVALDGSYDSMDLWAEMAG